MEASWEQSKAGQGIPPPFLSGVGPVSVVWTFSAQKQEFHPFPAR